MIDENANRRVKIWNSILNFSIDKAECECKLQKLFSYKRHESYYHKLGDIYYILEKFNNPENEFFIDSDNVNKIIHILLNSLIEYEYFYSFDELKKDGYDYLKYKKQYDEISKFIINKDDVNLKLPVHPNINYRDVSTQIAIYKIPKDDIENLLKIIFEVNKKPKTPKTHKKEMYQVVEWFEHVKQTFINEPELNEGYFKKTDIEKKQVLSDLEKTIEKWKVRINS